MADGWLTLADVPAIQAQRAEVEQRQQQIALNRLAIQQAQQEQQRRAAFQQYLGGGAPVANLGQMAQAPQQVQGVPGGNQAPVFDGTQQGFVQPSMPSQAQTQGMTPEQLQLLRGQRKLTSLASHVGNAFKDENAVRINKLADMARNDQDVQTAIKASGFDNIDVGYDEKEGKAWQRYTKTWTRQELDNIAQNVPGGQVLQGLPEGKYTLELDPINNKLRPSIVQVDDTLGKKSETELLDIANNSADQAKRTAARKILDEMQKRKIDETKAKSIASSGESGLTGESLEQQAERYLLTGSLPALGMGKSAASTRAAILNRAAALSKERDIDMPEQFVGQASLKSLSQSLAQQQKVAGAMGSFVRNLDKQVMRLEGILPKIQRLDARALNLPWRNYKTRIKGSANEAILDMYLTEISSEVGKLSTGSSASVAELSASAREKWEKIHDPNLPLGELLRLVKETQEAAHLRMESVQEEMDSTREKMIGRKMDKKEPSKGRFRIVAVE